MLEAADLVAGGAAVFGDKRLAVIHLLGRGGIEMNRGEQIGIGLVEQEGVYKVELLRGEAVMRHGGLGIVNPRILEPGAQPLGLDLGADASEFRADIATNQISSG